MRSTDESTLLHLIAASRKAPNRGSRRGVMRVPMSCPACGTRILAKNGARHAQRCPKLPPSTDG